MLITKVDKKEHINMGDIVEVKELRSIGMLICVDESWCVIDLSTGKPMTNRYKKYLELLEGSPIKLICRNEKAELRIER